MDAAANLFAEKGFHRTTTRDIAEAADVAEGTLYNYFASKEDLLLGIMDRLTAARNLEAQLSGSLPREARPFLVEMLLQRKKFLDEHHAMLQSVLSEILVNPELRDRYYLEQVVPGMALVEYHLQERLQQGQVRPLNTAFAARLLTSLMLGFFVLDVLGDPLLHSDWDGVVLQAADLLFDGAAPNRRPGDDLEKSAAS